MRSILVLCGALALSGCGSPPTQYFTLAPVPCATPRIGAPGAQMEVAPVMLPGSLDRLSYVAQSGPDRLVISDQDRWAEPLDGMIRRVLASDLGSCLPGKVLAPGDPPPPGPVRQVRVNVRQFAADQAGHVTLTADWSVLSGVQQTVVRRGTETIPIPARSARAQDAVGAMSQALGVLSGRIAESL